MEQELEPATRPKRKPGRPTKGGREHKSRTITMDDERWQYAQSQPGGASEYFRRLMDNDRKGNA